MPERRELEILVCSNHVHPRTLGYKFRAESLRLFILALAQPLDKLRNLVHTSQSQWSSTSSSEREGLG